MEWEVVVTIGGGVDRTPWSAGEEFRKVMHRGSENKGGKKE